MRCLVAADDPILRDVVASAAGTFRDVDVEAVDQDAARGVLRRRRFDFAVLTLLEDGRRSEKLWEEARQLAPDTCLIALTPRAGLEVRRHDRGTLGAFAILGLPVDAVELYATLRRLLDRIRKSPPAVPARSPR